MDVNRWLYFVPLIVVIVMGTWLSIIDLRTHRLPNKLLALTMLLLMPSFVFCVAPLTTLKFAIIYVLLYFALYFASHQQLGMGDVKYAGVLGIAVGMYTNDLTTLVMNTFLGAGIVVGILLALNRVHLKSHIAFGPIMTVGAIYTIALALKNV